MTGNGRIGLVAALLAITFVLLTTFVSAAQTMLFLNGVFAGLFVGVVIVYFPLLKTTVRQAYVDRSYQLIIAICLLFLSVFGNRFYWIIWKVNGSPIEWRNNSFQQFVAYLAVISGALFITAPGYPPEDSDEPTIFGGRNRRLLIASAVIGVVTVYAVSFRFELFLSEEGKQMKKVLLFAVALSLAACNAGNDAAFNNSTPTVVDPQPSPTASVETVAAIAKTIRLNAEKTMAAAETAYNVPAHAYVTADFAHKLTPENKAKLKPWLMSLYDKLLMVRKAKATVDATVDTGEALVTAKASLETAFDALTAKKAEQPVSIPGMEAK